MAYLDISATLSIEQIRFCAEECLRQESGEISVARMCEAYAYALNPLFGWNADIIQWMAYLINDPDVSFGYRQTPVYFLNGDLGVHPQLIEGQMELLLTMIKDEAIGANDMYELLEEIHPFSDGNGRLGAILYNKYLLSMDHPQTPPDVFHEKDARGI